MHKYFVNFPTPLTKYVHLLFFFSLDIVFLYYSLEKIKVIETKDGGKKICFFFLSVHNIQVVIVLAMSTKISFCPFLPFLS